MEGSLKILADPQNPNSLSKENQKLMLKSLEEFGDLSSIVFNQRTGFLVGGHQRFNVLENGKIETVKLETAEADGTTERGWVVCNGKKYAFRVVDWSPEKAHAAMLAANRFGRLGRDDSSTLTDLLKEIEESGFSTELTGYSAEDIAKLEEQAAEGLAEKIQSEPVYTERDSKAEDRAESIDARLKSLKEHHMDKIGKAKAIVFSADSNEFICIEDARLEDFLTELRRYSETGADSPLAAILEQTHKL